MRPSVLNPVFADVTSLKGVGPNAKKALQRLLAIRNIGLAASHTASDSGMIPLRNLLFHFPVGFVDRRFSPPLYEAPAGRVITVRVKVTEHFPPPMKRGGAVRKPYRVLCENETGTMEITFFNPNQEYIERMLPIGQTRVVSGKVEQFDYRLQMPHPEFIAPVSEYETIAVLEPVYPLTYAMSNRQLTRYIGQALGLLRPLPEWLDMGLRQKQGWPDWKQALEAVHRPKTEQDIEPFTPHRRRLAYDELLANQLALAMIRRKTRQQAVHVLKGDGLLSEKVISELPFKLTADQKKVVAEIYADIASGGRMLRLLQGDVGSGKTIVALLAMLKAVEEGHQAVLMVPTEILGRQHLAFFQRVLASTSLRVVMLSGSVKAKERNEAYEAIESGEASVVIGTHALFQDKVNFKSLALVVIDEQHRFGVMQRMALSQKGKYPHVLMMTATPIPRSLTMTAFGDMECSVIAEKPAGRKPIDTRTIPLSRLAEVVAAVQRAVQAGNKVYWICPLIEEKDEADTERLDLAAAEARYADFKQLFGNRVALAHGRMKGEERAQVMQGFAGSVYDVLVATTVVEVGVDVADATVMVIEHAERFGLSQLHQLRGRVGRGDALSNCILLYDERQCGEVARARLRTIRETEDGFRIAEEDLKLRGSGDILGTKQSGMPEFYCADLSVHTDLITVARDDIKQILAHDPELTGERGQALRTLLYLFSYDEQVQLLGG